MLVAIVFAVLAAALTSAAALLGLVLIHIITELTK